MAFREAFDKAQAEIKDADGSAAEVKFESNAAYPPFNLSEDEPAVKHAKTRRGIDRAEANHLVLQRRPGRQLARSSTACRR